MKSPAISIAYFLMLTLACKNQDQQPIKAKPETRSLITANTHLIKQDKQMIEKYIERHGYSMQTTNTGLYYMIYEHGHGAKVTTDDEVLFDYTLSLLDGSICYESGTSGPKSFIVGRSESESGLHEGMLLLREGDKARFILPPHLAFGLYGDNEKIPMRAVIVYDIWLKKVRKSG